jgi:hypothetical protein
MSTRETRRRAAGVVAAVVLAASAVAVTAPPASAAVLNGQAQSGTSFSTSGGGGCTVTDSGDASPVQPFVSGGAPLITNVQTNSVAIDPGDPADVSNMSAGVQATIQATEAGGVLTGFEVDARLTATVNALQGAATDCSSQAQSTLQTQGTFSLPAPAILDLRLSTRGIGLAQTQLIILRTTPPAAQVFDVNLGLQNRSRRLVTLPAGDYTVSTVGVAVAVEPDAPTDPTQADIQFKVKGTLSAPGTAVAARKGTGSKYLTLPDSLSCATHSVVADFTKKAGPKATKTRKSVISQATFYVNDVRVKKVKKPHKKTNVTLSGLPDTDELVVEARLKVRGKGTATVTRTYLPCS